MPQKKKIVFVLSGYGREARGAERVVAGLVERLGEAYDIQVLGSGANAPGAVPLRFLSRENRWTRGLDRTPGLGHLARLFQLDPLNWEWLSCAWAARRWLLEHPCDLLVPEGGRWGGWLGCWARKRLGIPFVDISHGAPSRWEVAAARCRPDAYVAPTRVAEQAMREAVPGLKTHVLPPGVDTSLFNPEGPRRETGLQRPVALAVGALEPLKRMDLAIRAVAARGVGSLLLVGDGPQREELVGLGRELLGSERFQWRTATASEMPALYRSADLLVSTSRSEAFGLVYVEALACGLPVVTQDDAVRREVLGEEARYVDSEDPAVWAGQMETALSTADPVAARERAKRYDVARSAARLQEIFEEILRRVSPVP